MIIGRDAELTELSDLLARSSRQVVSIVGPGGAGKSTLAFALAERLSHRFDDGAAFVSLASLDNPRMLVSEVTRALGIAESLASNPIDRLVWGLRGQRMLLVLDNFEHLIDAAGVVAQLSARCPDLALLVTSRRRLNLPNERVYELGGLSLADRDSDHLSSPAIELFVKRAVAVNPTLELDDGDRAVIAELCRQLDGLPLAIELVASHARDFTIAEIRGLLADGVELAELDDTIEWSCRLLGPAAGALLPRLAVFGDGWSLDAMQAITVADDETGFARALDGLVELIDLHLVEPIAEPTGAVRFGLLETVRRLASKQLEKSGDTEALRAAHAEYYRQLAIELGAALESPAQAQTAAGVGREISNLRAAMTYFSERGLATEGLAIAGSLGQYWLDRGSPHEGREWLRQLLPDADPTTPEYAVADAWEARFAFNDSLAMPVGWDDGRGPGALALRDRLTDDLATLRRVGNVRAAMRVAEHLVYLAGVRDQLDDVAAIVEPLISDATTAGEQWMVADLLNAWSGVLLDRGEIAAALVVNGRTVEAASAARNEGALARAMLKSARYAGTSSNVARADIAPIYPMLLESGDLCGATQATIVAGTLALVDHDLASAAAWWSNTIDLARRTGSNDYLMRGVSGAMCVASRAGRMLDGARLCGGMRLVEAEFRTRLPPDALDAHVAAVGQIRVALGQRFESECAAGEAAGWEAAVACAAALVDELQRPVESTPVRRRGPRANMELTERELDVLAQLVAGRTNAQIGDELAISPKTVMHHTMSVYRKLAVRGRAEAVAHAVKAGLVQV